MTISADRIFGRGAPRNAAFEPVLLPDDIKKELCLGLLEEFGATVRDHGYELVHGCLVGEHQDQERNPTASLNYSTLTFHCLGCGASGGILWFIATVRGTSTGEAMEWLNGETGLGGRTVDLDALMTYFNALYSASSKVHRVIPTLSAKVLIPWQGIHPYLTDPKSEGGREIPLQAARELQLGYAEEYQVDRQTTSERIVLPHFWRGKLVGWQTRRLIDDGTPKYLSSPDFPKDQTIYHYKPRESRVVLVEAMLSVASKMHLVHCEATFGASVTDEQTGLLSKHPVIVLFMDNDNAGWHATEELAEVLSRSCVVLVVENPWSADPADISDEDFMKLVDAAVPYSVWSRPTKLLCYECQEVAHKGPCR